jgi:hypothetical protein
MLTCAVVFEDDRRTISFDKLDDKPLLPLAKSLVEKGTFLIGG